MRQVFHQFNGITLEDIRVTNVNMEEALGVVTAYINQLDDNRASGAGLTILGPTGTGKTLLASMVLKAAQTKDYRIEAIEFSSLVDLHKRQYNLMSMIKAGDTDAIEDYNSIEAHLRRIKGGTSRAGKRTSADFVLLDDVGREHESASGWSNEQLFDLLRYRYNRGFPFLLTSNQGMTQFKDRYSEGMPSLLSEATDIIALVGEDFRRTDSSAYRVYGTRSTGD